jgi:hypothetical protein
MSGDQKEPRYKFLVFSFYIDFIYFLEFIFIIVELGVHCDIYKISYNIS